MHICCNPVLTKRQMQGPSLTSAISLLIRVWHECLWEQRIRMSSCQRLTILYIPANHIASQLGPRPAAALPMFHAFTGCDIVSFFCWQEKGWAWKVWQAYPEAKYIFPSLFSGPDVLDESFWSHQDASNCFCTTRTYEWWRLINQHDISLKTEPRTNLLHRLGLHLAAHTACSVATSVDSTLGKMYWKGAKTSGFHSIGMARRQTCETYFTWACRIAFLRKTYWQ